jgi:hypothetical protein
MTDDPTGKQPKNEHAAAMARLGAAKGGRVRAALLSPAERSQIAKNAAASRWPARTADNGGGAPEPLSKEGLPFSMFPGTLKMGNVELECHVLSNGRRVLTQREMVRAISGGRESGGLNDYLDRNPLIAKDEFAVAIERFRIPGNPTVAIGQDATVLIEICEKYLEARDQKLLKSNQLKLATQAEIVIRACAKVGIIALIDEATGFQQVRAKNALQLKLQAFIADELQEWAKMFPDEFWIELARLEGIRYTPRSRPLRWGKYVMMFVYDAIDGDVGRELRKKNPNPRFLTNHHQWLKRFGREKVHDQIERVVTIMKLCDNMDEFRSKFSRVFKKSPLQMSFTDIEWGGAGA